MYFSALKKLIASADQTAFYDVAILYLAAQRYRSLSIVDGTGDGGRDVICSRPDLRIQLSVRKDWESKINEEAANTAGLGLKHLIYVTNRSISPRSEETFRASKYKFAGDVEVTIHDLNRISTALARPGRIKRAYEMLGASVSPTVQATTQEIAVSSLLLFGQEAAELREEIVDANVKARLLRYPNCQEYILIDEVVKALPGASPVKAVISSISRLRAGGHIIGPKDNLSLSDDEKARMQSAESEFLFATETDIASIQEVTGLDREGSKDLLNRAIETLLEGNDLQNGEASSESVRAFLANNGLLKSRARIYQTLAECTLARHFQHAKTVNEIFETNTFDIYRALGGRTNVTMVLDTSVALPMLFGLEFQVATSRYAVGATTLLDVCRTHEIAMMVPRPYINEMASHGIKALEFLETYDSLPEDIKPFLRGSGNAYLSHFSYIQASMEKAGKKVSLSEFLLAFGLKKDSTIRRVENQILSLLESHNIRTGMNSYYDADIRNQIAEAKSPHESKFIIDHDAAVCTTLVADSEGGYILATWDKVLIEVVRGLARVYADSPARVTDFLSAVEGIDYEYDRSTELLTTLLHIDEWYAEKFARKLEAVRGPTQAFQLRRLIEEARNGVEGAWLPEVDDLTHFLDSASASETSSAVDA